MIQDYNEILNEYRNHINEILELISDRNLSKRTLRHLKKKLSKLRRFLKKNAKIFDDHKVSLDQIKLFINKAVKPLCRDLEKKVHLFLSINEQNETISLLGSLSKSLHDFGCDDLSKKMFNNLIDRTSDAVKLSELLDYVLECGYLDLALKIAKKMRENGLAVFAIMYNEALIKYLLGKDLESLRIVRSIISKYGLRPEILGLLSAIYIGIGELEDAKKYLNILRGHA